MRTSEIKLFIPFIHKGIEFNPIAIKMSEKEFIHLSPGEPFRFKASESAFELMPFIEYLEAQQQ
jgi:hypothetical protein